ncbi:DUF427 domain-containing protein [Deinococcus sp. KNUC1210]|uniref:DUF427 domain-containing protein n=1 Tax=Deinococcus sp. KNUC1210 TaxID=2917691 RepID=UPI001EF030AA|nr:DUF427 domain-containing protein [Deinococcus sp. KNUC1210]ULH14788.1 DUF427 domain-containing protein [Deinococcus sp. KNUC1210]
MKPVPVVPAPGQESVWDYPRPPRLERSPKHVQVWLGGVKIADTTDAYRVLETSHPPGYYLPPQAFLPGVLHTAPGSSVCEWKGRASYWSLSASGMTVPGAAWSYEHPTPAFAEIAGYVALYAGRVDRVTLDGEQVVPQPGDFYGGWITSEVVGPFKGIPGSWGW